MSHTLARDVDAQWKKLYLPIVAGSVSALAVIGVSIICAMKKKKKKSTQNGDEMAKQDPCSM